MFTAPPTVLEYTLQRCLGESRVFWLFSLSLVFLSAAFGVTLHQLFSHVSALCWTLINRTTRGRSQLCPAVSGDAARFAEKLKLVTELDRFFHREERVHKVQWPSPTLKYSCPLLWPLCIVLGYEFCLFVWFYKVFSWKVDNKVHCWLLRDWNESRADLSGVQIRLSPGISCQSGKSGKVSVPRCSFFHKADISIHTHRLRGKRVNYFLLQEAVDI